MAKIAGARQKMHLAEVADLVGMSNIADLLRTSTGMVETPPTLEAAIVKQMTTEKDQARKNSLNEALRVIRAS